MSYDSALAQIGDIVESDHSINPISTPSVSSNTSMAYDERSNSGDNELKRLHPLCGILVMKRKMIMVRMILIDYVLFESTLL